MEVLFSDSLASLEAYVIFVCIAIFLGIYGYDVYLFIRKFLGIVTPTRPLPQESETQEDDAPKSEEMNQADTLLPIERNEDGIAVLTLPAEETGEPIEVASPFLETITLEEIKEHIMTREEEAEELEEVQEKLEEEEQKILQMQEERIEEIEPENHEEAVEEDIAPIPEETLNEDSMDAEVLEEEVLEEEEEEEEEERQQESGEDISQEQEETLWEEPKEEIEDIIVPPEENHDEDNNPLSPEAPEENTTMGQTSETPQVKNNSEFLFALTNQVRTHVARGQTLEARGLIVQWLALEKNHRDLNLILAELYEGDRQFEKAEFIYKDLAEDFPNDGEILEKLANVLIIQKRYDIAREIYKKIVVLTGESEWSLYILTHLASELGNTEEKYEYAKKYQKNWPNNPEILSLLAQAEIALGKRLDAIETLKRLKNLTPYNHEIMETIQKLVMEEELAGNFGN